MLFKLVLTRNILLLTLLITIVIENIYRGRLSEAEKNIIAYAEIGQVICILIVFVIFLFVKYLKKKIPLSDSNKMIVHDSSFRMLHETDRFILGYIFEDAYLINKKNNKEIYLGAFYGDPTCGLISKNNDWCLVCGDTTTTWKKDGNIYNIDDKEIIWIIALRQTSICEVELLVDPWSEEGAIWKLNIDTLEKRKIKNFTIDGERTGKLNW